MAAPALLAAVYVALIAVALPGSEGGFSSRDAQERGVPHLLVVRALVLTFLLGPAGLLLYLAMRYTYCQLRSQQ